MSRSLGIGDTRTKKAWLVCLVLAGISFAVLVLGLNTGTIRIPPLRVLDTLFGGGSGRDHIVLFEYRLPRIAVTVLAGAGLGAAGAVMQGLSRNALADPGVLGLHAGAALGLVMFVSFFATWTVHCRPDPLVYLCRRCHCGDADCFVVL